MPRRVPRPPARKGGKRPDLAGTWLATEQANPNTRRGQRYYRILHWATPPWLTDEHWAQMRAVYAQANHTTHVDHIVPLQHPLVCGLHVPWNLQVLCKRENLQKSNNWWPDCPDHLEDKQIPMFDFEPQQLTL